MKFTIQDPKTDRTRGLESLEEKAAVVDLAQ